MNLLRKGQIKFSKKAVEIAKQYFKNKKANEFLIVIEKSKPKPPGCKDFYKIILGVKQDILSPFKVYTKDIIKAKKFFQILLLKEKRLSIVSHFGMNCLLYIAKTEQSKYEKFKMAGNEWPKVLVNEENSSSVSEFTIKINKTTAIDLPNLILVMNEVI